MLFFLVPSLVTFYLRLPEVCATLGYYEVFATLVTVPEAPVDKDDCAVLAHHNVGMSWLPRMVQPVSVPMGKQIAAHQDFRLGVFAADGCHAAAALFLCQFVHVGRHLMIA
jgi:hypothetical protein